jgi:hypothetical protein
MRSSPRRGVWLGLLLAALLIVTVAPVTQAGASYYQVDARIRRSGGELYGNGSYNGDGTNQAVHLQIYSGNKRIVYISIQNDGVTPQGYYISEIPITPTSLGIGVRYFVGHTDTDITDEMRGFGPYYTPVLDPGEVTLIRARVTVDSTAIEGQAYSWQIVAGGIGPTTDVVRIWAQRKVSFAQGCATVC